MYGIEEIEKLSELTALALATNTAARRPEAELVPVAPLSCVCVAADT